MAPTAHRLTFRDLDRCANNAPDDPPEIIDEELVVTQPPTASRQHVRGNTAFALERHLRPGRLGRVHAAPIGVRYTLDNAVQPDTVVVLAERVQIAGGSSIDGAPDIVVEIPSPPAPFHDRGAERDPSARFGVQEYRVLDPSTTTIEALAIAGDRFDELPIEGGVLRSRVLPGCAVAVADPFAPA